MIMALNKIKRTIEHMREKADSIFWLMKFVQNSGHHSGTKMEEK